MVPGHYPGDFIVEYIGQTWLVTPSHVLMTALLDRPAPKPGIVLGFDGQKMMQVMRNYPDVTEVFDRDGSGCHVVVPDASPISRGGNLIVTEQGIRDGVTSPSCPVEHSIASWRCMHRKSVPGASIRCTC